VSVDARALLVCQYRHPSVLAQYPIAMCLVCWRVRAYVQFREEWRPTEHRALRSKVKAGDLAVECEDMLRRLKRDAAWGREPDRGDRSSHLMTVVVAVWVSNRHWRVFCMRCHESHAVRSRCRDLAQACRHVVRKLHVMRRREQPRVMMDVSLVSTLRLDGWWEE
jgi:hypothetical protein